jgi:hypothetical protein
MQPNKTIGGIEAYKPAGISAKTTSINALEYPTKVTDPVLKSEA